MKKTLAILAASTAFGAIASAPVWSGTRAPANDAWHPFAAAADAAHEALPLIFASNDDDDEHEDDDRRGSRRDHDDDDDHDEDDDDDDDDCDDDDGRGCRGAANPAPAGSVAPPQNGLFGTGAAPKVQVN